MITNIFKLLVGLLFIAAITTVVSAQQPFDNLPTEQLQDPPPQDQEPIRIPSDSPDPGSAFTDPQADFMDQEPDQRVEVDERYAGWQAAGIGTNGGRLSNSIRANWVMADSNGLIQGTVRGIDGAETRGMLIYLLNQGRLVFRVTTDDQGNFELNNVVEGAYSLVGIGDNAFFCFSFNVLHHAERENVNAPTRLDVTAFQNKTTINNDWIQFFAPQVIFRVFGRYSVEEGAADPASLLGFEGLANHQPAAAPATSINSHQVVKTADGRLLGRVHQLNSLSGRPVNLRFTKVMLLQNDNVFDSTTIDNYGVFEFDDTPQGQYALVAASVDGLGCIGIDVVEPSPGAILDDDELGASVFDFCMATSESVGWLNHVASELAYERAILAPRPYKPDPPPCIINAACLLNKQPPGLLRGLSNATNNWFDRKFYGETEADYNNNGNRGGCGPGCPGAGCGCSGGVNGCPGGNCGCSGGTGGGCGPGCPGAGCGCSGGVNGCPGGNCGCSGGTGGTGGGCGPDCPGAGCGCSGGANGCPGGNCGCSGGCDGSCGGSCGGGCGYNPGPGDGNFGAGFYGGYGGGKGGGGPFIPRPERGLIGPPRTPGRRPGYLGR